MSKNSTGTTAGTAGRTGGVGTTAGVAGRTGGDFFSTGVHAAALSTGACRGAW